MRTDRPAAGDRVTTVEQGTPTRRLVSQPISGVRRRRRRFLWQDRVPLGEVTLFAGHAGIGKSQCAVWLASSTSLGTLPGELVGKPSTVLYLATEDSWEHELGNRFVATGADLELVRRLTAEDAEGETYVSLLYDLDALREEIRRTGAQLVILDALLSAMAGADLAKQGTVRRILEPLARLAQELNIAVVGVVHFRKSGGDPLLMISGSAEFGQVVRSAIGFARDEDAEDGSCILSTIKSNFSPHGLAGLRYVVEPATVDTPDGATSVGMFRPLGETEQSIRELLDPVTGDNDARSERNDAVEWVRGYLESEGGSAKAADIFKAARADGIAERTLKRARERAGVMTERSGFGAGSVWRLSPFGPRQAHSGHSGQASNRGLDGPNVARMAGSTEPDGQRLADVVTLRDQSWGDEDGAA